MPKPLAIVAAALAGAVLVLPACSKSGSGGTSDRRAVRRGALVFQRTCATCHGADAHGLPDLGKDLTISEFFRDSTDEELLHFVQEGREVEGGTSMPPRGGFPDLTDDEIRDAITYIRTLDAPEDATQPAPEAAEPSPDATEQGTPDTPEPDSSAP